MLTKTLVKTKTTKNLVVPIESELKKNVQEILDALGLNQSQIVVAFFKEIARTRKVPLSFNLNDAREPTSQEKLAIEEFLANPELLGVQESAQVLADLRKFID
jgi:addiction module RelB/DinJ family antitoxin